MLPQALQVGTLATLGSPSSAADARRRAPRPALRARPCERRRVLDYDYGKTGVAPNAIELQPIIGFRCLSG